MAKKTMPKGRSLKKRHPLYPTEKEKKLLTAIHGAREAAVAGKTFKPMAKQQALPLKLVKAKPSAQMLSKEATENLRTYRATLERELKIRYEDAKWKEIRRLAHKYEVGGMPAMDELTKEEEAALTVKTP